MQISLAKWKPVSTKTIRTILKKYYGDACKGCKRKADFVLRLQSLTGCLDFRNNMHASGRPKHPNEKKSACLDEKTFGHRY